MFALRVIHSAAPGFLLVSGICNLLDGFRTALTEVLVLRYVVNAVQQGKDFFTIAGVVLACFLLHIVLSLVVNYFSPWNHPNVYVGNNQLKVRAYIDKMLMEKARAVDLASYEDPEEFDRYFKAYDGSYNRIMAVYWGFAQLSFRVSNLSTTAAVIFTIDPVLMLFVMLPCVSAVLFKKSKDLNYEADLEKKKCRRARDYAMRTFYLTDFVKEMRMGNFPELMKWRFGEEIEAQKRIINRFSPKIASLEFVGCFLNEIVLTFGAIGYTVWQSLSLGKILYGDCLVVINSISSVSWGIVAITETFTSVAEASLYIGNIRDFLDAEITVKSSPDAKAVKRGDLEFRNVSFTYRGADKPTIKNLSFTVRDGEKIALVGQNGAGKTTLIKLLMRFYDVTGGEILLNGINIKEYDISEYRKVIGAVFQDYKIFAATVPKMSHAVFAATGQGSSDICARCRKLYR